VVKRVKVAGAPGFDDFEGRIVPGLRDFAHADGDRRCVVIDDDGEIFVFKSRYVTDVE
jgi:hypothetical protein